MRYLHNKCTCTHSSHEVYGARKRETETETERQRFTERATERGRERERERLQVLLHKEGAREKETVQRGASMINRPTVKPILSAPVNLVRAAAGSPLFAKTK